MERLMDVRTEVAAALATGRPVVALESTVYAHGLPHPHNLRAAAAVERAVRDEGAVPATIGLLRGRIVVGLAPEEIGELASHPDVAKVSVRDVAPVVAARRSGATTVAATAALASGISIRIMATGGIGGVHRGGQNTLDISADLQALAQHPIAVVCAGAKAVLDLGRTLEVLETLGVPVIGYRTDVFPAFYSADSGLRLEHTVDGAREVAAIIDAQSALNRPQGVLVVQAPPRGSTVPGAEAEHWVQTALDEAEREEIDGSALTPFLLTRVARLSDGRALRANLALLESNARLAAEIATFL